MSAIEDMLLKFTSGNDVAVQRAVVTLDEWRATYAEYMALQARVAELEAEKWNAQIAEGALASVEQERDELRRRVAELERYNVRSIANRICGEIPKRFHIEMVLENGAGWVSLFHDGKPVEIDMADWNIAEQFDVAMQCVTEYANQIEGGE